MNCFANVSLRISKRAVIVQCASDFKFVFLVQALGDAEDTPHTDSGSQIVVLRVPCEGTARLPLEGNANKILNKTFPPCDNERNSYERRQHIMGDLSPQIFFFPTMKHGKWKRKRKSTRLLCQPANLPTLYCSSSVL